MAHLHIPASIRCPPVENPLRPAGSCIVPYAAALHRVRASHKLYEVVANSSHCDDEVFAWLNQDNNSAIPGIIAEASKQTAAAHYFMFFRIRVADYRSIVNSLIQLSRYESLYSEEKLRKWTIGYRFRLLKSAPLKSAMRAFSCRMGIESDPNIAFCRDGFYGDGLAGSLTSLSGIPYQCLIGDMSPNTCGLANGSSIFVSRCTANEREAAAAVYRVVDEGETDDDESEASRHSTVSATSNNSNG